MIISAETLAYLEGLWAGFSMSRPYANNPYWPCDPCHNQWARAHNEGRERLNEIIERNSECHS